MKQKILNVVGVMSGTSLDACDFVLTKIHVSTHKKITQVEFVDHVQKALPKALRQQTWSLLENPNSKFSFEEIARLNQAWGQYYGNQFVAIQKQKKWKVDLIGLHGQTVYHKGGRLTWQMGSLAKVASLVSVPVVGDFRSLDVEMGYQGAPLAPLFHEILIPKTHRSVQSVHNLGGISNLTLIRNHSVSLAFDTGPANMPMDTYLASVTRGKVLFDKNGEIAAQGKVHEPLLSKLKRHSFFSKKPPKSTGREQFGGVWLRSQLKSFSKLPKEDVVSTLTEWVAWSMAHSYLSFCPKKEIPSHIYFCGGGALNLELLNRVQALLPQTRVHTTEVLGWPVFAVEAGCFAYLAAARVMGYRWNLHQITGNPNPIPLGVIYEA